MRLQTEAIAAGDQRRNWRDRLLEDTHRLESQIDKTLELARIEGGGRWPNRPSGCAAGCEHCSARIVAQGDGAGGADRRRARHCRPSAATPPRVQMILRNLVENSRAPRRRAAGQRAHRGARRRRRRGRSTIATMAAASQGDPELGTLFLRGGDSRGTGVGLYLVRVLMERMGGSVRFAQRRRGAAASPRCCTSRPATA